MKYLFNLFNVLFWWDMKFSFLGMGGDSKGSVSAPKMSGEEKAYLREMTSMVREQRQFNEMMMPQYAHQMHYKIDPSGEWTQMSDAEWMSDPRTTESQRRQFEIMSLTQRRQEQALKGELPLTEAMQRRKQEEFDMLKSASGITGTDPMSATAEDTIGIQKLKAFRQRWGEMEEAQKHGELGAGMGRLGQATGLVQQGAMGRIGGLQGLGASNQGSIQNYASLLQPYQAYNQMGVQARASTAANKSAMFGSLLGVGAFGAGLAASAKDVKKNIKGKTSKDEAKALNEIKGTKSYEFDYKEGAGPLGRQLGTMAEESPDAYTVGEEDFYALEEAMRQEYPGKSAPATGEEDFYAFEDFMRQKYQGESAPPPSEEDFYEYEAWMKKQPGKSGPAPSEEDFYAFEEHWKGKPGKSGKPMAVNLGSKIEHTTMGLKSLAREVDKLKRRKKK